MKAGISNYMLNKKLKLNERLFDPSPEQAPTRDGYGKALVELGAQNPNIVVLTADLSESTRCEDFAKKFPRNFFDLGVAEQNMVAVASGMAAAGKIAFVSSYATFSPGKNWETIRTTIIYNQANVKIAGHHSGIVTGPDGATHQATEDIAITRCWPDVQVIVPCDSIEAEKATIYAAKTAGPVYLRFTRDKTPVITTAETPYNPNKISVFWESAKPQVVIFGTGHILYNALCAAHELEKEGLETLVANVSNIKPIDEATIIELVKITGAIVSVEDHQITGGLGGAIAEVLARNFPVPQEFIGLQNTFAESGSSKELMKKYFMDKDSIKTAVKKVISRK